MKSLLLGEGRDKLRISRQGRKTGTSPDGRNPCPLGQVTGDYHVAKLLILGICGELIVHARRPAVRTPPVVRVSTSRRSIYVPLEW